MKKLLHCVVWTLLMLFCTAALGHAQTGSITVTIKPAEVASKVYWTATHDGVPSNQIGSGQIYPQLDPGDYTIQFSETEGWKTPADITVKVNAGQDIVLGLAGDDSTTYTRTAGTIQVTIKPDTKEYRENTWYWYTMENGVESHYKSGITYTFPHGEHIIKFPDVLVGWKAPEDIPVTVEAGGTVVLGGDGDDRTTYTRLMDGTLTITIEPQAARDAGAMWRIPGGDWQQSGASLQNVPRGQNVVEFKDIGKEDLQACSMLVTVADDTLKGSATGTYCNPAQGVPVVFDVPEGRDPSKVFVHFVTKDSVCGYYFDPAGTRQTLQKNTAYSLAEITNATKPVKPGVPPGKPAVVIYSMVSGRLYTSYDKAIVFPVDVADYEPNPALQTDKNYSTRYQTVELTCKCGMDSDKQKVELWTNLTYIDYVSIPIAMQAVNATGVDNPDQWTKANFETFVDVTSKTAKEGVSNVIKDADGKTVRVIAPMQSAEKYPDWEAYLTSLKGTTTHVKGCFVGVDKRVNQLTAAQSYDYNVTFDGSQAIFTAQKGSGDGNDPCHGYSGTGVGDVLADGATPGTITISYAHLNDKNGIYGNNPVYTYTYAQAGIDVTQMTVGIENNVFGWVVGDLMAGLSLGYPGSDVSFTNKEGTRKVKEMSSTEWWGGRLPGSAAELRDTPASKGIYFAKAQPDHTFYHPYAAAINPLTSGYGFGLQDRLGQTLIDYITKPDSNAEAYLHISYNPDTGMTSRQWLNLLYVAYLDRAPDPDGADYWHHQMIHGGMDVQGVAGHFAVSEEAKTVYPYFKNPESVTEEELKAFVLDVYQNLFNRNVPEDYAGALYWLEMLKTGQTTPGLVMGHKVHAAIQGNPTDWLTIWNKLQVAEYFTEQFENSGRVWEDSDLALASQALDGVTDDPETVESGKAKVDQMFL